MGAEALDGGLDLSRTLAEGRAVRHAGLLSRDGPVLLTMAEGCPPALAVRLGQVLDTRPGISLVALDEACDDDQGLPPALADRLGLFLDLDGLAMADTAAIVLPGAAIAAARARLAHLRSDPAAQDRLTRVAAQLGIGSLRAPLLALACARASAALRGADAVQEADLRVAVELVLAHRALRLPEPEAPPPEQPETPPPQDTQGRDRTSDTEIPDDLLVEAARAALPPGLIARLQAARLARSSASARSGAGARRKSARRGRPLPARAGKPGADARIDVIATLRQAAPWQRVRTRLFPHAPRGRLLLLPSDIRIRRHEDRSDRLLVFVVDASGSTAVARLAEAKGAVELMLAEAYATRDHVALVTFRGIGAELALPPTRSLVQAKRRLAGLPGGGGTPLAAALRCALETAAQARRRGMAATLALLTDGRGNIALDGGADRARAAEEATTLARAIAAAGLPSLIIDTALRPRPQLAALAGAMGARLIALPRADARGLSTTLSAALGR